MIERSRSVDVTKVAGETFPCLPLLERLIRAEDRTVDRGFAPLQGLGVLLVAAALLGCVFHHPLVPPHGILHHSLPGLLWKNILQPLYRAHNTSSG